MTIAIRKPVFVTLAAMALAVPAMAQDRPGSDRTVPEAGSYAFDPAHSHIIFDYNHMGFSTSHGMVTGVEGAITLDPEDLASATVEASFPLSALRTVSEDLDAHLQGEEFFNVEGAAGGEPPVITFKSTKVEPDGDDEARVAGDLTLNGVTKEIVLEVEFNGAGTDPMSELPSVGFSAETEIRRSDFNLGAFAPAVGDEVDIEISIEARKDG